MVLLTEIIPSFLFLQGIDVEKDTEDVGKCVDMYLHNYAGDALGTDIPTVRVIGVSTLFSRHQTGPIHLMWSFWFIFPAAFGCHSFPQAEICPICMSQACVSQGASKTAAKQRLCLRLSFFILLTSIALIRYVRKSVHC